MTGWRTLGASFLVSVFGWLQTTDWALVTDPKTAGYITMALGFLFAGLRTLTTTPVGKSE